MPEPMFESSRWTVISNTGSGVNRRLGTDRVERAARRAGMSHHAVDDIGMLDGILRASVDSPDSLIIVNGGDGTVRRVVEIVRAGNWDAPEPALALLRGGTTNLIHKDVGVPGTPATGLEKLVDGLNNGRHAYRQRNALRVTESGGSPPRYGFFLGTHAAMRAVLRARQRFHKHVSTGSVSEFLSITAMIWRLLRRRVHSDPVLSPIEIEYALDQGSWCRTSHILLLAMSVETLVFNIHPLARGQRAGVAILNWPDYRLFPWLGSFLRGDLNDLGSISMRGDFGWILDGECYTQTATDGVLTIDVDAPVRFVVGES